MKAAEIRLLKIGDPDIPLLDKNLDSTVTSVRFLEVHRLS